MQEEHEVQLVIRTTEELVPELTDFIIKARCTDTEVLATPVTGGSHQYMNWIKVGFA